MQCDKVLSEVFTRTGDSTLVRKLSCEFAICRRLLRGFEQTIKSLRKRNEDLRAENEILKKGKEFAECKSSNMHDVFGSMENAVAMTVKYQMKQTHELMKQKDEKLDELKTNLENKHADFTTRSWETQIYKFKKCFKKIKNNIGNYPDQFKLLRDMERIIAKFTMNGCKTRRTKKIKHTSSSSDDDVNDQNHIRTSQNKYNNNESQIIHNTIVNSESATEHLESVKEKFNDANSTINSHVCSSQSVPREENFILDGAGAGNVNDHTYTNEQTEHLNYTSPLCDLLDEFMNEQTQNCDAIKKPEDVSSKDPLDELLEDIIINKQKFKSEKSASLSSEEIKNADPVFQSDEMKMQSSPLSDADSTLKDQDFDDMIIIEEYEDECDEIRSTDISPDDCGDAEPDSESTERKYNLRKRKSINYAALQSGECCDSNPFSTEDVKPVKCGKGMEVIKNKSNFDDHKSANNLADEKKIFENFEIEEQNVKIANNESKFCDNKKDNVLKKSQNQEKDITGTNGVTNTDFQKNNISENFLFPSLCLTRLDNNNSGNRFVNEISSTSSNKIQNFKSEIEDKSDWQKTSNFINDDQSLEFNLQNSDECTSNFVQTKENDHPYLFDIVIKNNLNGSGIQTENVKKKMKKNYEIDISNLRECALAQEPSLRSIILELFGRNLLRPILRFKDDTDGDDFPVDNSNYRKSKIPKYEIPWEWKKDSPPEHVSKSVKNLNCVSMGNVCSNKSNTDVLEQTLQLLYGQEMVDELTKNILMMKNVL